MWYLTDTVLPIYYLLFTLTLSWVKGMLLSWYWDWWRNLSCMLICKKTISSFIGRSTMFIVAKVGKYIQYTLVSEHGFLGTFWVFSASEKVVKQQKQKAIDESNKRNFLLLLKTESDLQISKFKPQTKYFGGLWKYSFSTILRKVCEKRICYPWRKDREVSCSEQLVDVLAKPAHDCALWAGCAWKAFLC